MPGEPTFVARQPILDTRQRVYAYELLFRPTQSSLVSDGGSQAASASVISNAFLNIGLDAMTNGRHAFINVTRDVLVEGIPEVLPSGQVVLELTEDIEPDDDVLSACRKLRQAGYMIALDDFVLTDKTAALIPHANFIKVDFLASDPGGRAAIAARCPPGCVVIAEKIETVDAFETARKEGHAFFQGYFFGQPVIKTGRGVPGHHLQSLQLLTALQNPNISADEIEELVKPDLRLCYLILRTVNCAGFALRSTVHSIKDALILIGQETIRRWASLWVVAGLGDLGNPELITMSATRGRCCELLDARVEPGRRSDGFLIGMCSLLDAILSMPMEEVVDQLSLADEVRAALLKQDCPSRRRLDVIIAYERGDWALVQELALAAGVNARTLPEVHAEAWHWAHQLHKLRAAS